MTASEVALKSANEKNPDGVPWTNVLRNTDVIRNMVVVFDAIIRRGGDDYGVSA